MAFGWDLARDPYDAAVRAAAAEVQAARRVLRRASRRAGIVGVDGPVGDGPVGDGSVGDGPVGDGSVADGPVGDGTVADPRSDAALRATWDVAVHDARRRLRRARALVDWLRPLIDEASGDALAGRLRDARRRLGPARDAAVLLPALTSAWLEGAAAPAASGGRLAGVRADLAPLMALWGSMRDGGVALFAGDAAGCRALDAELRCARTDLRALRWHRDDGALLGRGLARLHRRAVAAGRDALEWPDAGALHRARRRWKALAEVVRWLRPTWPRPIGAWLDEVDELTDLLGEAHDQALLRERVAAVGAAVDAALVARVRTGSERRAERLARAALPTLARLVAEPTEAFVGRHRAYAAAARRAGRTVPS
jgi:CHAD domain-containing protein